MDIENIQIQIHVQYQVQGPASLIVNYQKPLELPGSETSKKPLKPLGSHCNPLETIKIVQNPELGTSLFQIAKSLIAI